jgi:hypothetical protein
MTGVLREGGAVESILAAVKTDAKGLVTRWVGVGMG